LGAHLVYRIVFKPLMRWVPQYVANRNVFKIVLANKRFRKLSVREFQTDGPAAQKRPSASAIGAEPVARYD